MSGIAILVYVLAFGIPVYLLRHFHSQAWYWHVLSVAAALGIGMIPAPPSWQTVGADLAFGFACVGLLVWGIGGLLPSLPRREKHAYRA